MRLWQGKGGGRRGREGGRREEGEGEEGCKGEDEGEKEVSMDTSEVPGTNIEGRKLVKVGGREEDGERGQEREETPSNEVAKEVSL